MVLHHPGELLIGPEAMSIQGGFPVLKEPLNPAFFLITPQWAAEFVTRFSKIIRQDIAQSRWHAPRRHPQSSSQLALAEDDLVQQVLLRLIKENVLNRVHFTTKQDFHSYLLALVQSIVWNCYRRQCQRKRSAIEYSLENLLETGAGRSQVEQSGVQTSAIVEAHCLVQELADQLRTAIQDCFPSAADSRRAMLVFHLYFSEGHTESEISRRQDINLSR